jgi:hypothetical protein
MTLPEGSTGAYRGGPIYTDIEKLLEDARDTYRAYPGADALMAEDPTNRRIGVHVFQTVIEEDREYSWDFWIHLDDLKKSPRWEEMKTGAGRLAVINRAVKETLISRF